MAHPAPADAMLGHGIRADLNFLWGLGEEGWEIEYRLGNKLV